MRPVGKMNRDGAQARQPYKTKNEFLRWLRKKNARQNRLAQEEIAQADRATSQAFDGLG